MAQAPSGRAGLPFTVTSLGGEGVPGVMVSDLAAASIGEPTVQGMLRALWLTHGVIVFRGLAGTDNHLALSRVFGRLTSHPTGVSRNALHPELADISYSGDDGNVVEIAGEARAHYLPWHSDLVYFAEINRGGILRAIEPSRDGGMTGFIDKVAVWKRLPDDLKARAEGLSVVYRGDFRIESCRYAQGATTLRHSASAERIIARFDDFPRVAHPLVCRHPESGELMLNFSPWFALGVEGMDDAEGLPLLDQLFAHLDDSRFAYFHRWEPEDMVLWDNWRMLHCSTGVPVDDRRAMQRTTIMGDHGLGRLISATPGTDRLERVSV